MIFLAVFQATFFCGFAFDCHAQAVNRKPLKKAATKATSIASQTKTAPSIVRRPAAIAGGVPTSHGDPNQAVEIRGQSRTLSMMLVLKNGKENINFIKVRKDYNPEIIGTQY